MNSSRLQQLGIALALLSSALFGVLVSAWFLRPDLRTVGSSEVMQALVRATSQVTTRVVATAVTDLRIIHHRDLIAVGAMDGGAIAALTDGFLLVTGDGVFHRLRWQGDGDVLGVQPLQLRVPLHRDAYLADLAASTGHADDADHSGHAEHPGHADHGVHAKQPPARLRVTDLLLEPGPGQSLLLTVSHQLWDGEQRCFAMAVSSLDVRIEDDEFRPQGTWTTWFRTQPCLSAAQGFDDVETGGALARQQDGTLLLSVGDHGFDGRHGQASAQDSASHYGKILALSPDSPAEVVSMGHRNPQGLTAAGDGRIWAAEHGPRGGDEVNLIERGNNYGWPLATYGTDYSSRTWPLAPRARNHGSFTEPAYVFTPSIAIAALVELRSDALGPWANDLLAASLRLKSVYRMRKREGRVLYAEPIPIGVEIRDLAEAADGRVALWSDSGDVVVLASALPQSSTSLVDGLLAECASCHEDARLAPSLQGVLGRRIADFPGFDYSAELRHLGVERGHWSEELLDAFLAEPQRFTPNTPMRFIAVPEASDRRALIERLRAHH